MLWYYILLLRQRAAFPVFSTVNYNTVQEYLLILFMYKLITSFHNTHFNCGWLAVLHYEVISATYGTIDLFLMYSSRVIKLFS